MGDVIHMRGRETEWLEALSIDSHVSTLQLYVDSSTGEAEVVQHNDDGDAIRTMLSAQDVDDMLVALMALKTTSRKRP